MTLQTIKRIANFDCLRFQGFPMDSYCRVTTGYREGMHPSCCAVFDGVLIAYSFLYDGLLCFLNVSCALTGGLSAGLSTRWGRSGEVFAADAHSTMIDAVTKILPLTTAPKEKAFLWSLTPIS